MTKRLGHIGYADLLRKLVDKPGTTRQFRESWGIGKTAIYGFVGTMHSTHVIHIRRWTDAKGRVPPLPVYAIGEGPDADPPANVSGNPLPGAMLSEVIAFSSVLRALESPLLVAEVQEVTGMARKTLSKLIRHMHDLKLVFIAGWRTYPCGGNPSPRYQFGIDQPDVPKPVPLGRNVINARHWARRKLRHGLLQDPLVQTLAVNGYEFQKRA